MWRCPCNSVYLTSLIYRGCSLSKHATWTEFQGLVLIAFIALLEGKNQMHGRRRRIGLFMKSMQLSFIVFTNYAAISLLFGEHPERAE